MNELEKLRDKVAKQLTFSQRKLSETDSLSQIEAWNSYCQALKYVLLEIDTLNEKKG